MKGPAAAKRIARVIGSCLAAAAMVIASPGIGTPATATPLSDICGGLVPHPPILISEESGPAGFTIESPITGDEVPRPGSGVVTGNGTEEDPFVIEGWCIVDPLAPAVGIVLQRTPGIRIVETESHVVVRNTRIPRVSERLHGIHIDESAHVTLMDNVIEGPERHVTPGLEEPQHGIRVDSSSAISVVGNAVYGYQTGIGVYDSDDALVRRNTVSNSTGRGDPSVFLCCGAGIYLFRSNSAWIEDNLLAENVEGIHLRNSRWGVLHANTITRHAENGITLNGSRDATVTNNHVSDSGDTGIFIELITFGAAAGSLRDNVVTGNGRGFYLQGFLTTASLRDNNIHENIDRGLGNNGFSVDARENWWGCPEGPGDEACDRVTGSGVSVDPWLTAANPNAGPVPAS